MFDYVYDFSNENISALKDLYDFEGKKVLTVLGSGDQYFASILNGAKIVDVFDCNEFAWYYFVLKFNAIKHLSYEEFYRFFIVNGLDSKTIYDKLRDYLPFGVREKFDFILSSNLPLSSIKLNNKMFFPPVMGDGSIIPYFDKEEYYRLQEILNKIMLPNFLCQNFVELSKENSYDLMLLSNIYNYISSTPEDYYKMLLKFKCPEFEALYAWMMPDDILKRFTDIGFDASYVPTVAKKSDRENDLVLSLRK